MIEKIVNYINKLNWKKWKMILIVGIAVPFGVILMSVIDSMSYEIDIFHDVYYMYLCQINLVAWACLYFIIDMWSKQKEVK